MKTYLFDTFNRYKRFSEELDAKTILCNRSWWVFNDSGEKEVYIFNTDGTLIIAVSGKVTNATWQYIPANKSLIITGNNQSYMVHPAFYDQMIFALQVDGTNDYAFLIDENNLPSTNLRSLADLKEHFAEKERQAKLAEEHKRQAELAAFMQKKLEEDRERQRLEKEAEEKRIKAEKEAEYKRVECIIRNKYFYLNIDVDLLRAIDGLCYLIVLISDIILFEVIVMLFMDFMDHPKVQNVYSDIVENQHFFAYLVKSSVLLVPFNLLWTYFRFKTETPITEFIQNRLRKKCLEYIQQNQKD